MGLFRLLRARHEARERQKEEFFAGLFEEAMRADALEARRRRP